MDCYLDALGSSSAHLAIGQNPKLLSTFHDTFSALQGDTTSSIIIQKSNIKLAAHRILFF